jgi:MerR family transcriptional regulator, light-induced transcriptional regulator
MSIHVLTPKELAEAIGVSESSLKRWADEGAIRCSRTAGGHRRIPIAEAIRFVRESRSTIVRPEILGLPDIDAISAEMPAHAEAHERLELYLLDGRAREARGLVLACYMRGRTAADIFDNVIAPAMHRIGERWRHDERGVFFEHRATDICIQAINQLRIILPTSEGGPAAVGGAPSGDPYMIPSLMSATVLASEGFNAINLGAETPVVSLVQAAELHHARLVWLSLSGEKNLEKINEYVTELLAALKPTGARIIIGGRHRSRIHPPASTPLIIAGSMTDLAAYARGLVGSSRSADSKYNAT